MTFQDSTIQLCATSIWMHLCIMKLLMVSALCWQNSALLWDIHMKGVWRGFIDYHEASIVIFIYTLSFVQDNSVYKMHHNSGVQTSSYPRTMWSWSCDQCDVIITLKFIKQVFIGFHKKVHGRERERKRGRERGRERKSERESLLITIICHNWITFRRFGGKRV